MLSVAGQSAAVARTTEAHGWNGLAFTDSQNANGDCYVALGIAAHSTQSLMLGTGVTNPGTRHPSVIASAIATIQVESRGRAMLGIARGDSAMHRIGLEPLPLAAFRKSLDQIQTYLRGEPVDIDGYPSRLDWLPQAGLPKVPVSVAATGPKVIELAAQLAERVTFSLGARPDRLRWAIEYAREARAAAGLDPSSLSCGAYVNAVAHPDVKRARDMVRGGLLVHFRFSTWNSETMKTLAPEDRVVAQRVAAERANPGAIVHSQMAALDDDFVDRFAVVGPSDAVAERLGALVELGLDHLMILATRGDPALVAEVSQRFGEEVIPQVTR